MAMTESHDISTTTTATASEPTHILTAENKESTEQTSLSTGSMGLDLSKLQALAPLKSVFIKQPVRTKEFLMELFCGCEMENLYQVFAVNTATRTTTHLFDLAEDSSFCGRQCCGAERALELNAVYPDQPEMEPLFQMVKPYRVGMVCCPATICLGRNYIEVQLGGTVIGSVRERFLCNFQIGFDVYDGDDTLLCSLRRCCCACECMGVSFKILTADGEETDAAVTKEFSGVLQEMLTTNDNFTVEFPSFMDTIPKKLLLMASAMLIEFKYFEKKASDSDK